MIIGHPQLQPPQASPQLAPRFQMQNKLRQQQQQTANSANTSNSFFTHNNNNPNNNNNNNNCAFNSCMSNSSSFPFSSSICNSKFPSQQQPQAPLTAQNFRNQTANLLNCTNNFILNNECNQVYIETGYTECPFHLKRTEWYEYNIY